MSASWLKNAVFYEIYPQSFRDTNADGIGDLQGIIEKLDYVKSLGCNALWLNPCFDSPFKDAGYDVRDYKKVAPRYGNNEDLVQLFQAAHSKGIKVLLDLVPGHTSEEHPWFLESGKDTENPMADRYIWTDSAFTRGDGMPFIGGEMPRNSTYIINFFKSQPALNYGYRQINEPNWQQPITAPGPMAVREAMKDIMRFWLDLGCDGFRVDMADSLVKNDGPEKLHTMQVWKDIAGTIHKEYPEAALVSEWNNPAQALSCGFDMDFYLDWGGNGYNSLLRDYGRNNRGQIDRVDNSYFKAESTRDMSRFLGDYLPQYENSKDLGLWCLISGNHDTYRLAPTLSDRERKLYFAFQMTMPGAPFLYYGDEIGMPYRWLPTKEGGYQRTGSRTPMQWNSGKNLGFSDASDDQLYLPVDPAENTPTVESQENDPQSLLHYVRELIALRQRHPQLQNYASMQVYSAVPGSRLFAYKRGDSMLAAVNPGIEPQSLILDGNYAIVYAFGDVEKTEKAVNLGVQSFVLLEKKA